MERTLHLTRPFAGRVARSMIKEIFSAGSNALRPLPGASLSPAIPSLSKRFDHLQTAPRLQPRALATSVSDLPSSRSRIIPARNRSLTDTFDPALNASVQELLPRLLPAAESDGPSHKNNKFLIIVTLLRDNTLVPARVIAQFFRLECE